MSASKTKLAREQMSSNPLAIAARRLALALVALCVVCCFPTEPEGELGAPTLASVQSVIFSQKCALADCHGGPNPRQGMSLEPGKTYQSTINVQAVEAQMARIKPGDPDKSYLIAKVEGKQHEVGGSGERMPLGFSPLSSAEIKLIRDWIVALGDALAAPPKITKVTPPAASGGAVVSVEGEAFGEERGTGTVFFGDVEASFVGDWSDTKISAIVPASLEPGEANIVVRAGTKKSNPFPFTVLPENAPTIATVTPDVAPVGALVEIQGSNFGDMQGTSTVSFGGVATSKVDSWSNNKIVVPVPADAKSGDLIVTVATLETNGIPFYFLEPKLSSIQAGVFTRRCALSDCHGSPTPPPDPCPPGLRLVAGETYSNIVGVDSCELPGTLRVSPGNRAQSYLYLKISMATPPDGDQMPADGSDPLSSDVIDVIGDWIDNGAKDD